MNLTKFLFAVILLGGIFLGTSCDDDDTTPSVDLATLQATINSASGLISSTTEGTAEGQFQLGSQQTLQDAIDLAQGVLSNSTSTQTQIDNANIALTAAIATFNASEIVPVDPDNLSGHWTFDGGSGTAATDFSGNGFDGTFGTVAGFGGEMPTWTADRYGNANKAIAFDKGAKVTIPYNTALNPSKMSISLWVNAAENRENNRFMGLHSWNGFKFQLQSGDKPFFTAATSEGIFDRDTDPALDLNTWYHLTVTIGDGNMSFYVNGTKVKTWEDTPGTMVSVVGHDLVFGVGSSKYADTPDNYDNDQIIPLAWGGYFHGALDEVRIYKSVLSDSQVSSIYAAEKP